MNHIKMFENFHTHQYEMITQVEFRNYKPGSDSEVRIPNNEIDRIRDIIDFYQGSDSVKYKLLTNLMYDDADDSINHIIVSKVPDGEGLRNQMAYIRCYEDEYYLVDYTFTIVSTYHRYYKCDQFEGLLQFVCDMITNKLKI